MVLQLVIQNAQVVHSTCSSCAANTICVTDIYIPIAEDVPNTNANTNTYNDYEAIKTKLSQSGENIPDDTVCNANANEGTFQLQQSPMLKWKALRMLKVPSKMKKIWYFSLRLNWQAALLRIIIN